MLMTEKIKKTLALALSFALLVGTVPVSSAQSMSVADLAMTVGKSLVIDYPVDIGRISTSNPEVVDAVPATAKEFLLHGKGHGAATVVVWAKNGARTMYNITVEHNLEPMRKLLSETFPNEDIRIQSGRDSVTLIGRVSAKEVADRAVAIATPLAKTVVSNLQLAAAPVERQIMLRVKFAELNRNAASQFGVNLFSTGATNTIAATTTGQFPAPSLSAVRGTIGGALAGTPSSFSLSDALNVFAFRPDLNLGAVIRALQNQDVLQILAEPNLVTLNGKEATFLVGGEFPVPVLQGGGNASAVTVQFREFGIRLTFNPVITPNGTIRMYVKPEVSTIDLANAVQLSGFTIPALATRRMETNVELAEGQSFAVAGLMDDRVTDQLSKVPGLASIPIFGQLFKTRIDRKQKTELVVIITPEIVKPYNPNDKLPTPDFPKSFLDVSKFKKTSSAKPEDALPANSKDKEADKLKTAEAGSKKSLFFWRNTKPSSLAASQSTNTQGPAALAQGLQGKPMGPDPDSTNAPAANANPTSSAPSGTNPLSKESAIPDSPVAPVVPATPVAPSKSESTLPIVAPAAPTATKPLPVPDQASASISTPLPSAPVKLVPLKRASFHNSHSGLSAIPEPAGAPGGN